MLGEEGLDVVLGGDEVEVARLAVDLDGRDALATQGELLGLLKDRDVQVALGALMAVLKGAGRALREANGETTQTANQTEVGR